MIAGRESPRAGSGLTTPAGQGAAIGNPKGEWMLKKIGLVFALLGLCALSIFLVNCGNSSSRPTGLLYVLTQGNNDQGNSVSSFNINLYTGNLSLINFNTSVQGGLPVSILLDPPGDVVFVLSQSNLAAYPINSDGSLGGAMGNLAPGVGTPIAMTRDAAGKFLFVIDRGSAPDATNCQTVPPDFPNLQCASIAVFATNPGSTSFSPVPGSPFPVNRVPSALSVIPFTPPAGAVLPCASTQDLLYVTYNYDPVLQNDNTLSTYCVDSSGTVMDLSPNVPYVTQSNPISVVAVNTNPAGQSSGGVFAYVGNQGTASGAISGFQVCTGSNQPQACQPLSPGQLVPVPGVPVNAGQNPVAMIVDPTNTFLYAVSELTNQVYEFRITTSSGAILSIGQQPYQPTGSQPVSLAIQPTRNLGGNNNFSGEYLYVANTNSDNITGFSVSTTSGLLSNAISVITPPGPTGIAVK